MIRNNIVLTVLEKNEIVAENEVTTQNNGVNTDVVRILTYIFYEFQHSRQPKME